MHSKWKRNLLNIIYAFLYFSGFENECSVHVIHSEIYIAPFRFVSQHRKNNSPRALHQTWEKVFISHNMLTFSGELQKYEMSNILKVPRNNSGGFQKSKMASNIGVFLQEHNL